MNIELTDLIISQLKAIGTMMAAGVLVATMWHIKYKIIFWPIAAILISSFLYYCTYGKVTFCAVLGLVLGMLLWKNLISKNFK